MVPPTGTGATPAPTATATPTPTATPTTTPTPATTANPDAQAALTTALANAKQALLDGQAALAANDFAAYGEAQKRLDAAIAAAIAAEQALGK